MEPLKHRRYSRNNATTRGKKKRERGGEEERKDAASRKWKRIAVEGRESVKATAKGEGEKGEGAGEGAGEECWQSMLLIRKARPLLWDQSSSRVHAESSLAE